MEVSRERQLGVMQREVHDGPPALNLGNLRKQNVQLIGAVTSIDVCGSAPHDYCASSGTRVHVFDGVMSVKKRQISRFKDRAYGASFRQDGKLIVAGGEDSVVQVFDAGSRTLLRQFKGHTAPVHVAKFAAGQLHVLSGSDDSHVSLWDVTSGQQVCTLRGHTDYVRAASNNPASADVWATCGYDHTCKLWDVRHKRCLVTLDHGAPIESVAFFPTGSLLVTAGGTDICIWHMLGSGQLVHRISAHQKTVTSVLVASMTGQAPHIMSAGLDGYVKTLDAETYQPSKVHRYSVPVMSMAASPGGDMLAVGMSDGMLAVHRKKQGPPVTTDATRLRWRPQRAVGARSHYATPKSVGEGLEGEAKVAAQPKVSLPRYEELLLKFRFVEALEAAAATQRDEIVEGVLDLVQQHGALEASLGAAPSDLVADLLKHCRRQLCKPQHARNAIAVAECLLSSCIEVIASDEALQHELKRLQGAVAEELRIQEQMMALQGVLGALTAA
ncbi:U3 small nucleolar RNA-associated protein 15 [Chlorella vulgaris]